MLSPTDIEPSAMVGKTIYEDAGGSRCRLVGSRIDVEAVVAKADLVTYLKAHGMNGTFGAFYAEQCRPGGRPGNGTTTNADITAQHFRERDRADFLVVGTVVRADETFPCAIVKPSDSGRDRRHGRYVLRLSHGA